MNASLIEIEPYVITCTFDLAKLGMSPSKS